MTCYCPDAVVFGHQPTCTVRPQSAASCGGNCKPDSCSVICDKWRRQARMFGWPAPRKLRVDVL